jgi:uncharacterized protein involved in type VI secretion and phage assembly
MPIAEPTVLDLLADERVPSGLGGRWYGVYPCLVSDIKDPDGLGRVKVTLPWSPDTAAAATRPGRAWPLSWAAATAGVVRARRRGRSAGGLRERRSARPYVIGSLWNGQDKAPESMDGAGKNDLKVLRSRNGVKITLDDKSGQEKLILETPGGQNSPSRTAPAPSSSSTRTATPSSSRRAASP